MHQYQNILKDYTLLGSDERENINQRITFLATLSNDAEKRVLHLGELRQKNLYYALIIFAGLFTVSLSSPIKLYPLLASLTLFMIMLVFCFLDRRWHKIGHGWRKTRNITVSALTEVLNDPTKTVTVPRYAKDGERNAEKFSLLPMIFYLLVVGSLFHFLYSCINLIKR